MVNICSINVVNICSIGKRNLNKLVVAHLNTNPLKLKFDSIVQKITGNVNILMTSETKLDIVFQKVNF